MDKDNGTSVKGISKTKDVTVWHLPAPTGRRSGDIEKDHDFPVSVVPRKNGVLYRNDGSHLVDNNTLVALALMIAESRTEGKEIMTKVVVNLINRND